MLGALGQREAEAGDRQLSDSERPVVRRQTYGVLAWSAVIAVAAGVIFYFA